MSYVSVMMKYMAAFALVATVLYFYGLDNPGGPQLNGWAAFQSTITTNPVSGLSSAFNLNQNPNCGWDIGCSLGNIGNAITGFFTGIGALISSAVNVLVTFVTVMFSMLTFSFTPALPDWVRVVLFIITAPFWAAVIMFIIGSIRGTEG